MTEQAYRYNKNTWSAAEARNHCRSHNGRFEAASPTTQVNSYEIRTKIHQGRPHLIVPVVMMVEGVHSGSRGPLLHLAEELDKFPNAWNGMPVVVFHPEDESRNISANSPEVIEREAIGRVYNTHMEGNKLKAEVWLDEGKLRQVSSEALEYIRQGKPLDVSVGVFTDEEETAGEWNGEHYDAIARNYRPDHLALLPGETGACSWDDGCGIRTNTNTNNKKGGKDESMKDELIKTLKSLTEEGLAVVPLNNELGYKTLVNTIQSKLDAMDDGSKIHFLQEVYEDHFIYEVRKREGGSTLYKRGYSVNEEDESVEFAESPEEVRRKVEYETLSASFKRTKFNNNSNKKEATTMSDDKKKTTPCCEDLVNELITNKRTKFDEADKAWLLTLEENQVAKLVPEPEKEKEPNKPGEEPPTVNKEQAIQVLKEEFKDPEKFLELVPEKVAEQLRAGLKLHDNQREKMIKTILANTEKGTWEEDDLKAMSFNTLEKVFNSVRKEDSDFTGFGDPVTYKSGEEPMGRPGITKVETKKE